MNFLSTAAALPDVQNAADTAADTLNQTIEALANLQNNPETLFMTIKKYLLSILPTVIILAVVLIAGLVLIRVSLRFLKKVFEHSKLDPALHLFILSMIRVALYILLGIILLTIVSTKAAAGLIAAMSIFGLAISLAVKDSLSNLAGGFSVLFTRPFALGDYVSIGSIEGTVKEIRLNYTVLTTVDNKVIHIPNGDVAKALITNFTGETQRRLDLNFSIAYEDDFVKAKAVIHQVVDRHSLALKTPEPVIRIVEHGDSAIVLCCRVWVNTPDYWTLYFDLLEQVKTAFDTSGISIPYPQLDVHIPELPVQSTSNS